MGQGYAGREAKPQRQIHRAVELREA
jgi:hypothetical protein